MEVLESLNSKLRETAKELEENLRNIADLTKSKELLLNQIQHREEHKAKCESTIAKLESEYTHCHTQTTITQIKCAQLREDIQSKESYLFLFSKAAMDAYNELVAFSNSVNSALIARSESIKKSDVWRMEMKRIRQLQINVSEKLRKARSSKNEVIEIEELFLLETIDQEEALLRQAKASMPITLTTYDPQRTNNTTQPNAPPPNISTSGLPSNLRTGLHRQMSAAPQQTPSEVCYRGGEELAVINTHQKTVVEVSIDGKSIFSVISEPLVNVQEIFYLQPQKVETMRSKGCNALAEDDPAFTYDYQNQSNCCEEFNDEFYDLQNDIEDASSITKKPRAGAEVPTSYPWYLEYKRRRTDLILPADKRPNTPIAIRSSSTSEISADGSNNVRKTMYSAAKFQTGLDYLLHST